MAQPAVGTWLAMPPTNNPLRASRLVMVIRKNTCFLPSPRLLATHCGARVSGDADRAKLWRASVLTLRGIYRRACREQSALKDHEVVRSGLRRILEGCADSFQADELRTANSFEVSDMVRRGEVSLGLQYFGDPPPELVCRQISEERIVVVCSAHHQWSGKRLRDPQQLRSAPCQ
jgi:hypothetical protein